jgi:crotonobetainyl-CoA:carnitine CoA-transferase CaiB-like acyl-CoA transferase
MQALENPFVTNHDRLQTLEHPSRGDYRLVANPIRSSTGETPSQPAPTLGQHTDEILRELNYSDANISELRTSKVI